MSVLASSPDEVGCPICGHEACEDHLPRSAPRFEPTTAARFSPALEVMREPKPVEIIEGIAHEGRVTVLVGASGGSKTFVELAWGACVSDGVTWMGRTVRQGSVAYISFEGDALGLRLRALRDAQGHRLQHVHILRAEAPLSPILDRDRSESPSRGEVAVATALGGLRASLHAAGLPPITLVLIDTLRASLTGSEDDSEVVSAYLRSVRRLLSGVPGAAAIIAHHAGWQDGEIKRKRERGSSALRGNVDLTLYLEHVEDADDGGARLTLSALKIRDAERPAPLHLIRRRVELAETAGDDIRRGPATSCVIEPDRRTREDREVSERAKTSAQHRQADLAVLKAMRDLKPTSSRALRSSCGRGTREVLDAITRITQAGWAEQPRQRQPWIVTDAGQAALSEARQ